MDLEQYRTVKSLTYDDLAQMLGLSHRAVARDYAIGKRWPSAVRLEEVFEATGGEVTLEAMHRRRLDFLASRDQPALHTKPGRLVAI